MAEPTQEDRDRAHRWLLQVFGPLVPATAWDLRIASLAREFAKVRLEVERTLRREPAEDDVPAPR
ncbi:MAG TPA: hypothetical protein VEK07_15910 [Polyangiaceae bacterium]|nr:hypothetical protein [Polyangiaceae bacterium]